MKAVEGQKGPDLGLITQIQRGSPSVSDRTDAPRIRRGAAVRRLAALSITQNLCRKKRNLRTGWRGLSEGPAGRSRRGSPGYFLQRSSRGKNWCICSRACWGVMPGLACTIIGVQKSIISYMVMPLVKAPFW